MTTRVDITTMADEKLLVDADPDWVKADVDVPAQPPVSSAAIDHHVSRI